MTKAEIIKVLEPFKDNDTIMIGNDPFVGEFTSICGKGQKYMIYKCVLKPGHAGECYCTCKGIHFTPDEK